ncbi:MAG: hypothetical protein MUO78_04430 [candidate division Zixibacteria bacterium]|nr:hypothetical protein [candidate division Zixibacteria bacterium]
MTKIFFSDLKIVTLIIFLLTTLRFEGCSKKTEGPGTSEPGGRGSGNYYDTLVTPPPSSFNCNSANSFLTEIKPIIDASYSGYGVFNRLYFELKKDSKIYRSNYVEFYSDDSSIQQLEFGGSLPTGTYTIKGYLKNIQLNSNCVDKIYVSHESDLGTINITKFSNPGKVMNIEYFCQDSDTSIIERYDVFLSPNTEEYMDIAFNIANTRDSVTTYNNNEPPCFVEYDVFDPSKMIAYISTFKVWGNEMFLCGIKGFIDKQGYIIPDLFGATYEEDIIGCVPTCSTGALVAVKTCIDFAAADQYELDYNDFVTATVVHELGHQRGAWVDHPSLSPKFCIMKGSFIVYSYYYGERPYIIVTYSNPHFCDQCITKIKNINW